MTQTNTENKTKLSESNTKKTHNREPKPIPSRQEFHRYASNLLSVGDFSTEYNSGYQVNRVSEALSWTYRNEKKRTNTYNYSKGMKLKR